MGSVCSLHDCSAQLSRQWDDWPWQWNYQVRLESILCRNLKWAPQRLIFSLLGFRASSDSGDKGLVARWVFLEILWVYYDHVWPAASLGSQQHAAASSHGAPTTKSFEDIRLCSLLHSRRPWQSQCGDTRIAQYCSYQLSWKEQLMTDNGLDYGVLGCWSALTCRGQQK